MDDTVYRCPSCGNEIDAVRVDQRLTTAGSSTVIVLPGKVQCGDCGTDMHRVDK